MAYHPRSDQQEHANAQQCSMEDLQRQYALGGKPVPITPRVRLLEEAIKITSQDRNVAYGSPEDNFQNIADYWNTYLTQARKAATMLNSHQLTAQDVAHMMILMKMARLATNPTHRDSLLDIAGYAACGEDCRVKAECNAGDGANIAQQQSFSIGGTDTGRVPR